jgi:16S rRNA C1402 (ribose-2'-O) methylase RsmI
MTGREMKGEITLVIGPMETAAATGAGECAQSLADRVDELMHQAKLDRKEALKLAAKERGMTRRAAYDELVGARVSAETTADAAREDSDDDGPEAA